MLRKTVRLFDHGLGGLVARVPDSWYRPLAILCLIVHPVAWMALILSGAALAYYLDNEFNLILSISMLVAMLQADVLKLIFRRPRPVSMYVDKMKMKSFSFPSAHAYAAAAGAGYVAAYMASYLDSDVSGYLYIILAALAVVIAISRVRLKAHFPSDVAGGLFLGTLAVVICIIIAS